MKNNTKYFYGLLGLTTPYKKDYITNVNFSFELTRSENNALFNKLSEEEMVSLIEEAKLFFLEEKEVYYKSSRYIPTSPLRSKNPEKILTQCLLEYSDVMQLVN